MYGVFAGPINDPAGKSSRPSDDGPGPPGRRATRQTRATVRRAKDRGPAGQINDTADRLSADCRMFHQGPGAVRSLFEQDGGGQVTAPLLTEGSRFG